MGMIIVPSRRFFSRIEWINIYKGLTTVFAIYIAHTTNMYYVSICEVKILESALALLPVTKCRVLVGHFNPASGFLLYVV